MLNKNANKSGDRLHPWLKVKPVWYLYFGTLVQSLYISRYGMYSVPVIN
jgi:hypothetical protein